jgi:hypothetical protein
LIFNVGVIPGESRLNPYLETIVNEEEYERGQESSGARGGVKCLKTAWFDGSRIPRDR